ncbi:ATP synthase subunit I [Massilia sp. PAMC28688]|uniref:ATP synthase subunit I n=1 Tax=Massilia sp. PAMC28688 TaxID=2861283 RepID=UPI001C62B8DE|nr:ATP synthase subunit I [Massilia sp. PAMC28688]QYF95175.1 ATP synthase subunit I [Massilia sp. PAMC28688]
MLRLVSLQLIATVVAGVIAALLGGLPAMFSALLGALCCLVPNALMAYRLYLGTKRPGGANAVSFLIWEFVKIAMTVALLFAAVKLYRDLNWLAFLGGCIVVLKSYIFLLIRH